MSPGKKPELRKPPRLDQGAVDNRLADLERATDWATQPAVEDAAAAGLSAPQEAAAAVETELVTLGFPLRGAKVKREKKAVGHLIQLDPELNERIEAILDHTPRLSKQKFIMRAIHQYVGQIERAIERVKAGQGATASN